MTSQMSAFSLAIISSSILCFILMITVMVVSMEPSEGLNVKSANPEPEVGCKEPVLLLTDRDDSSVVAPSAARH